MSEAKSAAAVFKNPGYRVAHPGYGHRFAACRHRLPPSLWIVIVPASISHRLPDPIPAGKWPGIAGG